MTDKKINRPLEKQLDKGVSEEQLKRLIKEKKKAITEKLTVNK